jgi:carotenoid cleavage dioxygenase
MDRRELLRRLAVAGSAPFLLPPAAHAKTPPNWQQQFLDSATPWKSAFETPADELPLTAATVRGRFPDALMGTLYRIGPAGHDLGGERNHHWFDGDGMAHRFVIDGSKVHHQGRYVATAKRQAETRAGRRLVEGFGTTFPGLEPVSSPDSMNVANINVLYTGGELLALWEGGSATRLDPGTLETLGLKRWRADLAGAPFSAHPRVDPDGTVWNFGVSSSNGLLVLYEIAADGALRRAEALPIKDLPMIHDFAVTPGHLVFPLVYDAQRKAAGASFLDAHVWRPELGMRALVISKKDWRRRQILALPAGFLFHVGNAWEEERSSGTVIHVDYVRSPDASSVFTSTREIMRGRLVRSAPPHLTLASLDLGKGSATQVEWPLEAEFPRMDPRLVGLQHGFVIHASQTRDGLPLWSAVARTEVETGRSQHFSYGPQSLVEEHMFVPDAQGSGWVLGTVFDWGQKKTLLSCFAADALADGPVAQASLPYALPLGLHGNFVAAT